MNAVATAVKDFFFKRLPPLLPTEHMTDLESIASMQVTTKQQSTHFLWTGAQVRVLRINFFL